MEIIKLFGVNIFLPVRKFSCLTILLFCKRGPFESLISSGHFSKKLEAIIGHFVSRKEGRENTQMFKVAKSFHQVIWAQKTKKRELL